MPLIDEEKKNNYRAIILINLDPRIEKKVKDEILGYPGVVESHFMTGLYDLRARIFLVQNITRRSGKL